jgi:hypothetical protein
MKGQVVDNKRILTHLSRKRSLLPVRTEHVAILLLLCLAAAARGQTISGNVSTTFGVPIPGVTVTATRAFPFERISDTTDASGDYSLGRLGDLDGTYNVVASKAGHTFSPASTNITVDRIGGGRTANFTAPATEPAAITSFAFVTATSARLTGEVNPRGAATRAWFEFGLTEAFGSVSSSTNVGGGINDTSVSITVTNLLNNADYYFRLVASNSAGTSAGATFTFMTQSGLPSVSTLSPTEGGATSMRLNGSVNPNGTTARAWFEVGTTTNYEFPSFPQNIAASATPVNFSQMLTELTAGTTYHFRAAAATGFATNYGSDRVFTPRFGNISAGLPGVRRGAVAWGDYDNDGRLDLLLTGATNVPTAPFGTPIAQVWRSTSSGFSNVNAGLPGVASGSVAWGDYDNDGWLDFLLTGSKTNNPSGAIAQIWRNTGTGFININAGLPGVYGGTNVNSVAWGDYNNDGRLDILMTGLTASTNPITQLWRNTPLGFVLDTDVVLPGLYESSVAWGDYDNDGWLDMVLTGLGSETYISEVWRNTGSGFSKITVPGLPQVGRSSVAWGDFDNDTRLDILLTGTSTMFQHGDIWRNTGSGFSRLALFSLPFAGAGVTSWGDYDSDGGLDILIGCSSSSVGPGGWIYRNNRNQRFSDIGAGLPALSSGASAWGDYDRDGRLDIVLTGLTSSNTLISQVWRNFGPETNRFPAAPSGLTVSVSNSVAVLAWSAGADPETPVAGLSYNLRIGTTPGGSDVIGPMSDSNGLRSVPRLGNAQMGLTAVFKFETGTPYYWSVQTVDSAFAGSPFAPESSFKILPTAVPVSATDLVPGDTDGDGVVETNELAAVLANYWANNPWLHMTNPMLLGDGFFQFALTNEAVWNFSVEVTTNMIDWEFLGPAFPVYQFFDAGSTNEPQRYYRLRWP